VIFPPCIELSADLQLPASADATVHLVRIGDPGDAIAERMAVLQVLSNEERQRAERFVRPGLRGRYIYTRATLRKLLAERLNSQPELLAFEQTEEGRPYLSQAQPSISKDRGLDFNVSHSGDLALIVIGSAQYRFGIDIEQVKEMRDLDQMASRVLTPHEFATLNPLDELTDDLTDHQSSAKLARFFRYWTCKEAYLKALGTGLQIDMQRIELDLDQPQGPAFRKLPGRVPELGREFTPAENHRAALILLPG